MSHCNLGFNAKSAYQLAARITGCAGNAGTMAVIALILACFASPDHAPFSSIVAAAIPISICGSIFGTLFAVILSLVVLLFGKYRSRVLCRLAGIGLLSGGLFAIVGMDMISQNFAPSSPGFVKVMIYYIFGLLFASRTGSKLYDAFVATS